MKNIGHFIVVIVIIGLFSSGISAQSNPAINHLPPILDLLIGEDEPFSCSLTLSSLTHPIDGSIPPDATYGATIEYEINNRPSRYEVRIQALLTTPIDEVSSNGISLTDEVDGELIIDMDVDSKDQSGQVFVSRVNNEPLFRQDFQDFSSRCAIFTTIREGEDQFFPIGTRVGVSGDLVETRDIEIVVNWQILRP